MQRKGFTLIELLVVISIIALLMSVLLPALGRVREAAKATVCASNMKNMTMGCFLYSATSKDSLPPWRYGWSETDRRKTFLMLISPYMEVKLYVGSSISMHHKKTVFYCPSDRSEWAAVANYGGLTEWPCTKNSYSANMAIMDEIVQDTDLDGQFGPRKLAGIKQGGMTIMLMEGAHHPANMVGRADGSGWHGERSIGPMRYTLWPFNGFGYHIEKSNWAFVDGHIGTLKYKATLSPSYLWSVKK